MRFPISRLGLKLVLWSALVILLIVGAGSYWEYQGNKEDLEGFFLNHLKEEASALGSLVTKAEDERQVQAILDAFTQGLDAHDASIVDARGIILASTNPEWVGRPLQEAISIRLKGLEDVLAGRQALAVKVIVHGDVKVMAISLPLLKDEKIRGAVHLSEPYTKVEERLRALLVRRLLIGLTLAAGLLLFLNLALAKMVVIPVRKLSQTMEEVEEKGLEVQVAVPSKDEIGQLAASFTRMLELLQERDREVHRRSEEWERTFDAVPDLISIQDRAYRIVQCNKALASKLGTTPDRLIGETCYRVLHGREAPWPTCPLPRTLQTGEPQTVEIKDPHLNGTFVVTCSPLFEGGKLLGAVHVARDVTEERQLAKEAEEKRTWEEISRLKSEFIANMSHELRTPLNSIIGFSEILVDKLHGDLNEKQLRYVNNILVSGKHLLALINDILDVSKVEAGKLELHPEKFDLREALKAGLVVVAPMAAKKRITLNLEVGEGLSTIHADPARFKQILYNLLSNAVKFTPAGGNVTVSARVRSEELGVRGQEQTPYPSPLTPHWVEIAVQDTGIGIKKEDLPKLFQPFTQLDASIAKRHEGTGLGLALTKRLVELHGGRIWAESEGEGRGSTFTVRLPLG